MTMSMRAIIPRRPPQATPSWRLRPRGAANYGTDPARSTDARAPRDVEAFPRALARLGGLPLALVTSYSRESRGALEAPEHAIALRQAARQRVEAVAETLGREHEVTAYVRQGPPVQALHDVAEHYGAAAIVVGSTHRGTVGRVWRATSPPVSCTARHGGINSYRVDARGAPTRIATGTRLSMPAVDVRWDPPRRPVPRGSTDRVCGRRRMTPERR
jgi:nucleotide-binding universal stress UspA family protein